MDEMLNHLDEDQRTAVLYNDGPSLVVAGAGSGKTRVLTYKIAWLLKNGYDSSRILALTFTNKAANEMKSRIEGIVGAEISRSLWMGTFHSIFVRILRAHALKIGYNSNFSIFDTSDSRSLLKDIVKELNLDEKEYDPKKVLSRISNLKNNLITPDVYCRQLKSGINDDSAKTLLKIYYQYFVRCYKENAMDFDDILLYTNILFRDFPEVLEQYQELFQFILVDEYQDTNIAQHRVVKELADKHHRVCVVGDDAQSIYSFRGANIDNILKFKEVYPECKVFKLERNYRSTSNIVQVANNLIEKNQRQLPKHIYSKQSEGSRVKLLSSSSYREEAELIVSQIKRFISSGLYQYRDMGILYRTNSQFRVFEDILRNNSVPFVVYGGQSFYQRKEIKDIIGYFRLILNNADSEAFKRVVNYPARGIGETTLAKIKDVSLNQEVSLWEVASDPLRYNLSVNSGTANKLVNFCGMITSLAKVANEEWAYDFALRLIEETKINDDLKGDLSEEGIKKIESLTELLNSIREYCDDYKNMSDEGIFTIYDFLGKVSLMSDNDEGQQDKENRAALMTIHAAKGLEFKNVFIVGVEEEVFPSRMSMTSEDDIEEERRLFYVAITRAEENCFISYAKSRFWNGTNKEMLPSRFIKDIDSDLLDCPKNTVSRFSVGNNRYSWCDENHDYSANRGGRSSYSKPWKESFRPDPEPMPRSTTYVAPRNLKPLPKVSAEVFAPSVSVPEPMPNTDGIEVGCWVEHERFGRGTVLEIENVGGDVKFTINFQNLGEKKILQKYAHLKNLGK